MNHILSVATSALSAVSLCLTAHAQYPELVIDDTNYWDLKAFDFDTDGDLDLYGASSQRIFLHENLGGNSFAAPLSLTPFVHTGVASRIISFEIDDLDGDGFVDMVVANASRDDVIYYRGLLSGGFDSGTVIGFLDKPFRVALEDLNADNLMDVVIVEEGAGRIVAYANLGAGTFGPEILLTDEVSFPRDVVFADFDADGLRDMALVGILDEVVWHRGLGAGNFGVQRSITTAADFPTDLAAGDFDGDGEIDLVVISQGDNEVGTYRNLGGGNFGPQQIVDVPPISGFTVKVRDYDVDGDQDILVGFRSRIKLYENIGSGQFAAPFLVMGSGNVGSRTVLVEDIDNDSDLDFVTPRLAIYVNESTIGATYCSGVSNSTGVNGSIVATGATDPTANAVTVTASNLPGSMFGFFLTSRTPAVVAQAGGSQGTLCLGGTIGRYAGPGQILRSDITGSFRLTLDLSAMPIGIASVPVTSGQTWRFQAWHRDTVNNVATSNLTDAVEVLFN